MDVEKIFAISLLKRIITPKDRWFWRNVCRIRACLQEIIDEKRKMLADAKTQADGDIINMLMASELYAKNDEFLKDELFTIFLAGM